MLKRISVVAASATLIAVGTLAFSGATPVNKSNLSSKDAAYGQLHSSTFFMSDRSNLKIVTLSDLSRPKAWGYWCWWSSVC